MSGALSPRHARLLRAEAHDLEPTVHVGKGGVNEAVAREIDEQLEHRHLVKVRLLAAGRGEADRKALARDLAARVGAALVEVKGNTLVLYRE